MSSVSKDLVNRIVYSSNVWMDLKEHFDKVNATKIYHAHRGIATLVQGTSTVFAYFSKLSELWEEYESLVPPSTCTCDSSREFISNLEQQKLVQFLVRLNEHYNQSRSQILMITPTPSVNPSYSLIIHEEGQHALLNTNSSVSHYEDGGSSALNVFTSSRGMASLKRKYTLASHFEGDSLGTPAVVANFTKGNTTHNLRMKRNSSVQCDFCHLRGHIKDQCYKLIGYPFDLKFTRNREREQHGFIRGSNYNSSDFRSAPSQRNGGYSAHTANANYNDEYGYQAPSNHSQ